MPSVRVAKVTDVPVGQGLVVQAGDRTLALFNVDGAYHAIDNVCPHRGGPMGDGDLDGQVAICPWHGWRWDVTSGRNVNNPAVRVACFPVTVEGEALLVELPEAR
jgi:nitrite reductase/ring-hydroxylating ferredoxin subunit